MEAMEMNADEKGKDDNGRNVCFSLMQRPTQPPHVPFIRLYAGISSYLFESHVLCLVKNEHDHKTFMAEWLSIVW